MGVCSWADKSHRLSRWLCAKQMNQPDDLNRHNTERLHTGHDRQTTHSERKKLYFGFVDLEKAFDKVPREVISWAMRKLGVQEWLVSAVMSMYSGAKTQKLKNLRSSERLMALCPEQHGCAGTIRNVQKTHNLIQ